MTAARVLFDYFKATVYELSLKRALLLSDENGKKILCPYEYFPIVVGLSSLEQEQYRELTRKIMKLKSLELTPEIENQIQNLYINPSY